MPTLEFFVPALAGYLVLRLAHPWKFGLRRESGYHVVFRSTLMGLLLYLVAAVVEQVCPWLYLWVDLIPGWSALKISKAAVGSLLIALASPHLFINWWYKPLRARRALAEKKADLVDLLICDAYDDGSLIEVAFPSGKTYLGLIVKSSTADDGSDTGVLLVPVLSGYRDNEQGLLLTTSYAGVLANRWQQLAIAIRCSELKWLRRFDTDLYPWGEAPHILVASQGEAPDLA